MYDNLCIKYGDCLKYIDILSVHIPNETRCYCER